MKKMTGSKGANTKNSKVAPMQEGKQTKSKSNAQPKTTVPLPEKKGNPISPKGKH
jgi:hypothetical protein